MIRHIKRINILFIVLISLILFVMPAPTAFAGVGVWTAGNGPGGTYSISLSPYFACDQTIVSAGLDDGILKSTDGGVNWSSANNGLVGGALSVAVSPAYSEKQVFNADKTIFASTVGSFKGIYKSTDGGATWFLKNTGLAHTYVNAFAFSPKYNERGIAGTNKIIFAAAADGVYKSMDGGENWNNVLFIMGWPHVRSLAISPNGNTIFAGLDSSGGLYKSTDGGDTWNQVNSGLTNLTVIPLAISPDYTENGAGAIYAGTDGGGVFKSINGGNSWNPVNTGLTDQTVRSLAVSPNYQNDQIVFAGTLSGVFQSNDEGQSWTQMTNNGFYVYYGGGIDTLAVSPNFAKDTKIYAGRDSVYSYAFTADTTPPAPPSLTGFLPSLTEIDLYWHGSTDNVGVVGYKVYDAITNSEIADVSDPSYYHKNLSPMFSYRYYVKAYDAAGNLSASSNTITIAPGADGDLFTGQSGVIINPDANVTLTFTTVTGSGHTIVGPGPMSGPSGFSILGRTYEISTSALYAGPIQVALKYDDAGLTPTQENNLKLWHFENSQWIDVTQFVDIENNIIFGQVNSLSPFVIGMPDIVTGADYHRQVILGFLVLITGLALITYPLSKQQANP